MSGFFSPAVQNAVPIPLAQVPCLDAETFREVLIDALSEDERLVALFGHSPEAQAVQVFGVLANGREGTLRVTSAEAGASWPALTPDCPQAHWFERELAEQFALPVDGHPWLKPIRFHAPFVDKPDVWAATRQGPRQPCVTAYFPVEGEEVHEVAVGPVHAGIIEPGHFRFQCHGEDVFHLEISLGYQHRGIERALVGGSQPRTVHFMETLAGDTSVGHALAYAQILEGLMDRQVPPRALSLRGIALELERLANHTGDLGALAGDVGFLPTMSFCGRIRGDFLNMTALLCGSRFGRGMVRPGGVAFDLEPARGQELLSRLAKAEADVTSAVHLLWDTSSVMARFEETGTVSQADCQAMGLVGVAARACGVERDVRFEFPTGIYRFSHLPVSTCDSGDVFARAWVRWLEIQRSLTFVRDQVLGLLDGPHLEGPVRAPGGPLEGNQLVVSLTEGWRGELCHVALTDEGGRFARYKVVDASFHNWMGLAMALRNQQISDFPLCNKSFNLSYCGHDL